MNTTNSKKRSVPKAPQAWNFVTNHLNLLYMLAAGLVMEPSGFRGKYYVDTLCDIPGWIPLFRKGVPAQALNQAISERSHLRPCIVSLDLSGVSGRVQVMSREGKKRDVDFPNFRLGRDEVIILVPAPLPLTMFSQICFISAEDENVFKIAAKDVSNVDLKSLEIKVDHSMFINKTEDVWPPKLTKNSRVRSTMQRVPNTMQGNLFEEVVNTSKSSEFPIQRHISPQALGGLLAMLYHGANRSDLGVKMFQRITDGSENSLDFPSVQDPILAELPNWLNEGKISEFSSDSVKLYWNAVDILAVSKEENFSQQPLDLVLEYFETQLSQITEEKFKLRLELLIADMRSCFGLGGGTISELFGRNKDSLSRSFLLFSLYEHCSDLLEFQNSRLRDEEYLLACILFGVRDGWLKMPTLMRNKALSDYVMNRMAGVAHKGQADTLLIPEPAIPQPLRTLFPSGTSPWNANHTTIALQISKDNNWLDCIEPTVETADGFLPNEPKQENEKFISSGKKFSTTRILPEKFLRHLGSWPPIDEKLESEIRNHLNL